MANTQRLALLTKLQKVLKQYYKPVSPDKQYTMLEHMLYASCLENSPYDKAGAVYQRLKERFFDWNEVRVSTATELAEVMTDLFDASAAASQLKRVLQGTFDLTYSFELEQLKKQNLGVAIKQLEKMANPGSFVLHYGIQNALAGHAIPLDRGAWEILVITGIATPQEAATGHLTGLERIVPKNKGAEFGSLLHQLGVEYLANPQSPNVKKIITSINPQSVFPKRGESALKVPEPPPPPPKPEKPAKGPEKVSAKGKPEKGKPEKAAAKTKEAAKAKDQKPAKGKVKPAKDKSPAKKKSSSKQLAKRKPR
jgi:hypothetical protein